MHPNPAFHTADDLRNIAFARARAFGTLATNGEDGPLTAHVPFLLSEDGSTLELHLVRSNPIATAAKTALPAVVTVLGPDSYISPDWYDVPDQVPTWNYIAVRLRGSLMLQPQDRQHDLLDRQSAHFEEQLTTKAPWTSAKMSDGVMERMMRAIVPLKMDVSNIEGTWKLNQNKSDDVRLKAAGHVEQTGLGTDLGQLAQMMRDTK